MENFSSSQKVVASIVQRAAPTNDGLFHYYARLAGAREEYYYKFQCVYSDQQILESSVFQVTNNKPDLLISAVSIKYRLNGYFITVTIKNRGYAMASTSDSFIKVKVTQTAGTSTVYEANEAMALKRGESKVISVGPINIKGLAYFEGVAYVDPDKTISELNESNNAYQKKLPIYRPDFALRDIIIAYEPQAAIDDEQIHTRYYTYVTFTNKGMGVNAATQDMTKDLFVMVYFTDEKGRKSAYGAPIWEYYFWNGYTRTIRIAAPMDTGESRIMKATAIIDTNNKYEENNENNNTLSKNLPVPKK
jgi:subtilase family serine protease